MLSRPALSIRRLISTQKKQAGVELDEDLFYQPDEIDTIKAAAYKDGKGRTWKTPLMRRPNSKLNFDIPRSEDIHRISLIPPFPDTPHSSRSSLCSCENGTNHESTRSSPSLFHRRSPRSSPLLRPRQAEHPARGPSRSPPRIPMEPPHSPPPTPQPSQHSTSPEPDADLADFISSRPSNDEGPLTPESTEQYLDKLIRETDEAFKLQDTFVDAKLPSPGLPEHRESFQVQDEVPLPLTPTRPTRARSQRISQSSIKSPTKAAQFKLSMAPNAGTPRSLQPKTKRTRSKKSRRRSRAISSQPSRWGLSESAKDLFNIFSRIEADEMLPESTLREIRMSRASQRQWAKYNESAVTGIKTTDEHEARIDSLNARVGTPPVTEQVDTPPSSVSKSEDIIDRDDCATPKPEPQPQKQQAQPGQQQQPSVDGAADADFEVEDDEDTLPIMMMMDDSSKTQTTTAPAPPPKRNSPRRLPSKQLPPLPTIPEVITTGSDNTILSPTSATQINEDDYIFLPSTRYTYNMRAFRHGPIRLAKADLPGKQLAVDDTLDWTAFQMAILGGAGDFFSEPTDYSRPSEAELDELEDIATWFASLGLGGPGSLVKEDDSPSSHPADRPRSVSSYKNSRISQRMSGKRRSSRINPSVIQNQQQQQQHQRRSSAATTNSRISVEAPIPIAGESSPTTPKPLNNNNPRNSNRDSSSTASTPRQISPKEMGFQPLMAEAQPRRYLFAGAALSGTANNNTNTNTIGGGGGSARSSASSTTASAAPRTLNHVGLAIDSSRRPSVDSVQSLPQSPMLDLVVSRDVQGDEYVVPMGFNLGHDLGDFLKWEAENVFAPGYGFDGQ